MHWCYTCYAVNAHASGPCVRCGHPVEGPPDLSYDSRLIWALGHPDGDRAVLAAQSLGARQVRSALPTLRRTVDEDRDPYLAVAALRAAIAIAGPEELRGWLEELGGSDSFMVRDVAQQWLLRVST